MNSIAMALNDFGLPIVISADNEYQSKLSEILNRYLLYVKKVSAMNLDSIQSLEEDINNIIWGLDLYYQADFTGAKKR